MAEGLAHETANGGPTEGGGATPAGPPEDRDGAARREVAASADGCSLEIAAGAHGGEAPLAVFHPMERLAMAIEGRSPDGIGRG